MGSLWQDKIYLKSTATLLVRQCFNRRGLDYSKEVLAKCFCAQISRFLVWSFISKQELYLGWVETKIFLELEPDYLTSIFQTFFSMLFLLFFVLIYYHSNIFILKLFQTNVHSSIFRLQKNFRSWISSSVPIRNPKKYLST